MKCKPLSKYNLSVHWIIQINLMFVHQFCVLPGGGGSVVESGTQSDLKPMIREKVCRNGWLLHF